MEGLDVQPPFTVSSAKSSDDDNMDASILMSPDYVQPLVPSELGLLVRRMFDRDNIAWMRHSTAKKLAQAGPELPIQRQPQLQPFGPVESGSNTAGGELGLFGQSAGSSSPSPGSINPSDAQISLLASGNSSGPDYRLARITDYTRQEEQMSQIHLAKWVSDLQRSLQNERERYTTLARGERAIWLTERLNECVVDGSLVPISQARPHTYDYTHDAHDVLHNQEKAVSGRELEFDPATTMNTRTFPTLSPHDPLGVINWADDLHRRGWAIMQIIGSFGIVGGLALLLAKATLNPSSGTGSGPATSSTTTSNSGWTWVWNPSASASASSLSSSLALALRSLSV